jgi:hypothetical protein
MLRLPSPCKDPEASAASSLALEMLGLGLTSANCRLESRVLLPPRIGAAHAQARRMKPSSCVPIFSKDEIRPKHEAHAEIALCPFCLQRWHTPPELAVFSDMCFWGHHWRGRSVRSKRPGSSSPARRRYDARQSKRRISGVWCCAILDAPPLSAATFEAPSWQVWTG